MDAKVNGTEIPKAPSPEPIAADLMPMLKASVEAAKKVAVG